jgi:16S rRNA (cytosine967-C5)-methyltransferase
MIAPARLAALDALALVDAGELDLGAAVSQLRATLHDDRDRALLLELVSGTLRMRNAIDFQLARQVTRPLLKLDAAVLRVLRLSGYQLLYLSRLPASAVINDAVELTRRSGKSSAAGLTNAVLRALYRERERLQWPPREPLAGHLAVTQSHPRWLVDRWLARYGAIDTERWLTFNNQRPPICLAVNRTLTSRDALAEELAAAGVSTRPTSRAAHGLEVIEGRPFSTEAFAAGRFIVQDEASQLIAELAEVRGGARVLDLCASPGGKTVALAASVGPAGVVVAMDVRPNRVQLLMDTIDRCHLQNVEVVHGPPDERPPFQPGEFALVLVDAPCSGLGTVRRDPDIRWRRVAEDLPRFAAEQRRLLAMAADFVQPGGTLIYSTCSSEPEENDEVVSAFLRDRSDFALERRHQTLPFSDHLEAFFAGVLRRGV